MRIQTRKRFPTWFAVIVGLAHIFWGAIYLYRGVPLSFVLVLLSVSAVLVTGVFIVGWKFIWSRSRETNADRSTDRATPL
jgi:hypothetical protein